MTMTHITLSEILQKKWKEQGNDLEQMKNGLKLRRLLSEDQNLKDSAAAAKSDQKAASSGGAKNNLLSQ